MAKFVQIIEFDSDQIDEIQKLDDEWEKATEGKRTSTRATMCVDRDNPGHYFAIIEFPSYEEAQKNDVLPETQAFAEKMMKLASNTEFHNTDVRYEQT